MAEITVCFLVLSSKAATEWFFLFDLGDPANRLLFFNSLETVVCFLPDLGVVVDFFCAVSLVVAIVFFLLSAGFDEVGVFLLLVFDLSGVGLLLLTDFVCVE
ncbi:hypothetical protein V3O24_00655 [Methylobacter sp. Wu8]|nr:hypothetical protein [Methylobacter tundripaludum]